MINKVVLAGEIARDIKIIKFKEKLIINLIISTWDLKKKTFHRIIIYNNLAQLFSNVLKKFQYIIIEGKISNRRWLDYKNKYNYITEIIAEKLSIIKNKEKILKLENENENEIYNLYKDEIKEQNYISEIKELKDREDGYEAEIN